MKCRGTGFKVVIMFLIFMSLTLLLSSCGSSKRSTSSDKNTTVDQPTTGNQEQENKPEPVPAIGIQKLLTPADVEQVTGYKGVTIVPYNPQVGAGGKLNFAVTGNKLILAVMVEDQAIFDGWKGNKDLNAAAVPNLGDEAFRSAENSSMYTPNVTFIKGEQGIQVFTFFNLDDNMKPYMDHETLIKLAKIIEGRM